MKHECLICQNIGEWLRQTKYIFLLTIDTYKFVSYIRRTGTINSNSSETIQLLCGINKNVVYIYFCFHLLSSNYNVYAWQKSFVCLTYACHLFGFESTLSSITLNKTLQQLFLWVFIFHNCQTLAVQNQRLIFLLVQYCYTVH